MQAVGLKPIQTYQTLAYPKEKRAGEIMTHYLQAFRPRENDPLTMLVARKEDLLGHESATTKKSKEKVVPFADVCKIIFGDGLLFQTLTPHEMNMHSLGERLTRFSTRPFSAPSMLEFMAVTKELLAGHEPKSSEYSDRFYKNGGLSPAAFRVLKRYGDDVIVSSERTHFVGDVMLLGTFIEMANSFNRLGDSTPFNLDFVGELSQARRTIEAEAGVISVFHENYRPIVLTMPYYDGNHRHPSAPVLLQPGDVVWSTNAEAMYLLNEFATYSPKIGSISAVPNRTFVKTTGTSCSATTLVGYGRNMHSILRCGTRSVLFGSEVTKILILPDAGLLRLVPVSEYCLSQSVTFMDRNRSHIRTHRFLVQYRRCYHVLVQVHKLALKFALFQTIQMLLQGIVEYHLTPPSVLIYRLL